MTRHRELPIGEFTDADLVALLDELGHACETDWHLFASLHFIPFLIHCQHPGGSRMPRAPLHPSRTHPGYLETQIGKIESAAVVELCGELAIVIGESLEMHTTSKLMTFLNRVVRVLEKRSARHRRPS